MPMPRAVRLCPGATVVPVPWGACAVKSRQIREVLLRFTPAVEQASSDEFYLDLTGTEGLYESESLADTARRMREAVIGETSLSLSIGAGTSKLVAKLAAGLAKPRPGAPGAGVYVVSPGAEGEFMRRFALADIPLVGPKSQARLARFGLRTVEDVVRHDRPTLVRWLGEREGQWLYERVRGVDRSLVEPDREPKSISRDETFPRDLDRDDALGAKLLALSDRAAADLRDAGLLARTVTVKIRDADFTTRQASRTLPEPVSSDRVVYAVARELVARLRQARRGAAPPVRGVVAQAGPPERAPTRSSPSIRKHFFGPLSLIFACFAAATKAAPSAGTKSAWDFLALGNAEKARRLTPALRRTASSRAPSPALSGAIV